MSAVLDLFTALSVAAGAFFFFVGTLGLMRLPDPLSRLQVLSKAGTLALGLVVLGLLPQVGTIAAGLKLVFIWLLVLVSAARVSQLIALNAQRSVSE